jgi:hypothetical protein
MTGVRLRKIVTSLVIVRLLSRGSHHYAYARLGFEKGGVSAAMVAAENFALTSSSPHIAFTTSTHKVDTARFFAVLHACTLVIACVHACTSAPVHQVDVDESRTARHWLTICEARGSAPSSNAW